MAADAPAPTGAPDPQVTAATRASKPVSPPPVPARAGPSAAVDGDTTRANPSAGGMTGASVGTDADDAADAAAAAWADEHAHEVATAGAPAADVPERAGAAKADDRPAARPAGGKPLLSLEEAVAKVPEGVRLQLEERLRGRFREVRRIDPSVLRT